MAEKAYTILSDTRHPVYCIVIQWALASNDTGKPFDGIDFPDKTVQMTGTFGAAVAMQGSNELPTPTNWSGLVDPQGNAISMSAAGIEKVLENPYWIRPSAGAVTSVVITLACAQTRR